MITIRASPTSRPLPRRACQLRSTATTTGPIFVGQDKNGNSGPLNHTTGPRSRTSTPKGTVGGSTTVPTARRKSTTRIRRRPLSAGPTNCNPVTDQLVPVDDHDGRQAATAAGIVFRLDRQLERGVERPELRRRRPLEAASSSERDAIRISSCKPSLAEGEQNDADMAGLDDGNAPCMGLDEPNVPSAARLLRSRRARVAPESCTARVAVAIERRHRLQRRYDIARERTATSSASKPRDDLRRVGGHRVDAQPVGAELALNGPFEADPPANGPAQPATMNFNGSTAVYSSERRDLLEPLRAPANYSTPTPEVPPAAVLPEPRQRLRRSLARES